MPESEKKKGIRINKCIFQGEILGDPVVSGDYVFVTMRTSVVQRDPNGQYVDLEQDVMIMGEPGTQAHTVVKEYLRSGRRPVIWCHYKSWETDGVVQHAFVADSIILD